MCAGAPVCEPDEAFLCANDEVFRENDLCCADADDCFDWCVREDVCDA